MDSVQLITILVMKTNSFGIKVESAPLSGKKETAVGAVTLSCRTSITSWLNKTIDLFSGATLTNSIKRTCLKNGLKCKIKNQKKNLIGIIKQLNGSGVKRMLIVIKITCVYYNACGRTAKTTIQVQDLVVQKGSYVKEQGPGKIATKQIINSSVTRINKLSMLTVSLKLHMQAGRS